jgi:hypothetical protein
MANFGETERYIKNLFVAAKSFDYEGVIYTVLKCGKPTPSKGECKTDVYVLAQDTNNKNREFKISVKQDNADFLENKISLNRAIEILGDEAQNIIKKSILKKRKVFEDDYLVYFNSYKRTEALCLKMGWKFEFINKPGGEKCGEIELTNQQKVDIYAGTNLNPSKRNCIVNGEIIQNSGVANYIINVDALNKPLDYYLKKMKQIDAFAKGKKIYFVCKALNYRVSKNKWDGDRPLAVYVNWTLDANNKLNGDIVFENPLSVKGNVIGESIIRILAVLNINKDNFSNLRNCLHKNVNII